MFPQLPLSIETIETISILPVMRGLSARDILSTNFSISPAVPGSLASGFLFVILMFLFPILAFQMRTHLFPMTWAGRIRCRLRDLGS
jgi:hypothetical protein